MSTQQPDVQKNDTISVTIDRQPGCQVKFTVDVTPEAVIAAYSKAVRSVGKDVSIPGFRKGKAPETLIKDKFNTHINREWFDIVLQTGFSEAIHLTNIHPLKEGSIKKPVIHKCSKEEGANFVIEFETRPTIPTIDIDSIQIKKIELPPVTEDKIQQALENLRFHYSQWEEIKDRPVQHGDFVNLDVDILEEPQHQMMSDARVQVKEDQMPAWLSDLVIGLNAGEGKEGVNPEAEKHIPLKVTVKSIWKAILPEINDEFAKKLGLQTADELKAKITDKLAQDFQRHQERAQFKELEDFLVQRYPFDLPASYVKEETKVRLENHLHKLKEARYAEKDIKEHRSEIEESIKQRAIEQLQLYFLLHKVAADQHIEISADDVTQELSNQIALMSMGENEINFQAQDARDQIQSIALNKKIRNFLLSKATFE